MLRSIAVLFLAISIVGMSPETASGENGMEKVKEEIIKVERDFSKMATEKGVKEAFLYFAAGDAVILRNNRLFRGKAEIGDYFDSAGLRNIILKWEPDFVEVSSSGDLAYTYGKYTFSATDAAGKKIGSEGIFHTVWKKQIDGNWKYVWD
jgi:ketosteroid isomerase-like protein